MFDIEILSPILLFRLNLKIETAFAVKNKYIRVIKALFRIPEWDSRSDVI